MDTNEAFQKYINDIYPTIRPKPAHLRSVVRRFNSGGYLSDEKKIEILQEHFTPIEFKEIPVKWELMG